MFRDKVFNISFLLSFAWHIFCIFAFVLVITPKGFMFNKFPTIVFLGPILEEGPLHYAEEVGPAVMVTPYKEDFVVPLVDKSALDVFEAVGYEGAGVSFAGPVMQKQIPDFTAPEDETKDEYAVLSGPGIIYKPDLPVLPGWAKEEKTTFCVDAEIFISGEGLVSAVGILSTTGHPELDIAASRYARGFIFEPTGAARKERIKITLG